MVTSLPWSTDPYSAQPYSAQWYQQSIPTDIAQQQANQLGISTRQLYNMYALQAGASGNPADGRAQQYLGFQGAFGGGSAPQQPQGTQIFKTGAEDPQNALSLMGAQALKAVGLNPSNTMTVNPPPSGTPSGKSGVAPTSHPTTYDISGVPMPQTTVPSVFTQVPQAARPQVPTMAITPAAPATAAGAPTYTPFAQAPGQPPPPAPSAPAIPIAQPPTTQMLAAHMGGLADAGRAMFAHFGGDPNSATHADITDFHNQLQSAIKGGPPIKLRSGGLVPGRGNQDTVPALLTPGEYVVPKSQVAQLFGGRTPHRMAEGGPVTDDNQEPSEVRKRTLATTTNPGSPMPQLEAGSSPGTSQEGTSAGPAAQAYYQAQQLANLRAMATMRQNAALSANTPAWSGATTPAAQQYAAQATAGQVGGTAPTSAELQAASVMSPGQIQGSMTQANMPAAGAATAIGGLASGLSAAAQAYAQSVKPWQMQRSAIPNPPPAPSAPQFVQQQVPQPQQRSNLYGQYYNPYMMGLV